MFHSHDFFSTTFVTVFFKNHVIKTSHVCAEFLMVTVKNCCDLIKRFFITQFVAVFECNHVIKIAMPQIGHTWSVLMWDSFIRDFFTKDTLLSVWD